MKIGALKSETTKSGRSRPLWGFATRGGSEHAERSESRAGRVGQQVIFRVLMVREDSNVFCVFFDGSAHSFEDAECAHLRGLHHSREN